MGDAKEAFCALCKSYLWVVDLYLNLICQCYLIFRLACIGRDSTRIKSQQHFRGLLTRCNFQYFAFSYWLKLSQLWACKYHATINNCSIGDVFLKSIAFLTIKCSGLFEYIKNLLYYKCVLAYAFESHEYFAIKNCRVILKNFSWFVRC